MSTIGSRFFGWGDQRDTLESRILTERRLAESLEALAPSKVIRAPAKLPVNEELLLKIQGLIKADGFDAGYDLTYLPLAVFGQYLRWLAQIIGSCVASGGMRAWTLRALHERYLFGEFEQLFGTRLEGPQSFAHFGPFSYRAGRRIGNLNSGDGSFCGAHIQGLMRYGALPCSTPGLESDAFPEPQNAQLYRRWGSTQGNALMDRFAAAAKLFILNESEQIESADALKDRIIVDKKPAMICSQWAFRPREKHPTAKLGNGDPIWIYTRDKNDEWAHNMTFVGALKINGNWYIKVLNSWPESMHKNGYWFVVPIEEVATWLASKYSESRTIGDIALKPEDEEPIAW